MNLSVYQQRVNAMRLNRQAPGVKKIAEQILKETKAIENALYGALDPEDQSSQWAISMIDHAHSLVDLGHEYKLALSANPPPQDPDPVDKDAG